MELNYRLSLCRRVMTRAGWHEREGSCAELVTSSLLERVSDTQDEGALHDRDGVDKRGRLAAVSAALRSAVRTTR